MPDRPFSPPREAARSPLRVAARRTGKALAACAIGYLALWLTAVLGTLGMSLWAKQHYPGGERISGVSNFQQVDDRLWRGGAPSPDGYRELAERGIRTVVDLRAEDLSERQLSLPGRAGLDLVRMPVRDGQTPTEEQVGAFLTTVDAARGPVYVHCGAGVGRTGSMSSAYLVRTGQADAGQAVLRTLAVGPPSVEQIWYVLSADSGHTAQPPPLVRGVSRVLDAPRRINASLSLF
ncbi:fused DSP-PTPase phosphatase/NAD kinase-like protein [Streptomyces sp. SBT349]|uniref:fused DSP-PTPase phosphatase/NAD kinase-like protein n=1 Tax=Streptomyces sp. SBT349 TaxID=1580539 RepID=UPI001F2384C5|nr:sulfur transferase domain-containing protein [Streptomyces sp. SBT349]